MSETSERGSRVGVSPCQAGTQYSQSGSKSPSHSSKRRSSTRRASRWTRPRHSSARSRRSSAEIGFFKLVISAGMLPPAVHEADPFTILAKEDGLIADVAGAELRVDTERPCFVV